MSSEQQIYKSVPSLQSIHQQRVEQFMLLAGQEVPLTPVIPSEGVRRLRAKLIWEEVMETIRGLGFSVVLEDNDFTRTRIDDLLKPDFIADVEPDLEEIADGCADIIVVTTGTLSACGIADESIQREVDEANLRKFGPGHSKREDGKLIKPPGFRPPDIAGVLAAQGWKP